MAATNEALNSMVVITTECNNSCLLNAFRYSMEGSDSGIWLIRISAEVSEPLSQKQTLNKVKGSVTEQLSQQLHWKV